jgi:hypothetical protein
MLYLEHPETSEERQGLLLASVRNYDKITGHPAEPMRVYADWAAQTSATDAFT